MAGIIDKAKDKEKVLRYFSWCKKMNFKVNDSVSLAAFIAKEKADGNHS